ncbi:hypothetical protein ACJIZ3_006655 [Penstemon smallii]|uniref:Uncharacterized protein n=1 Tax=Penstemon smallii TaxID=265156 RepID=A0ABD3S8L4_9LAMI
MESSASLPFPQFPIFPPKPNTSTRSSFPFRPCRKQRIISHPTILQCQKMYVPGFGEASPEAKAAKHLHDFFTYIAVKIVHSQLEVPLKQSYNEEAYWDLKQFLENHSLDDGDKFVADLMRESSRHKGLGTFTIHLILYNLSIYEVNDEHVKVRSAYCKNDFEWDNLKRVALKMVDERNTRLMRDYVSETSSKD